MSEEHQTWWDQAKQLQNFIPCKATMSKTKLKGLVISHAKVDANWVRGHLNGFLKPHRFSFDTGYISHFLSGGKFMVLLHKCRDLSLKKIQSSGSGEWSLVDVARYEQQHGGGEGSLSWSKLLMEMSHKDPALAYMSRNYNKCVCFVGGVSY